MWLAFAYDTYYPLGGMKDCVGVFSSRDEALSTLKQVIADKYWLVEITPEREVKEIRLQPVYLDDEVETFLTT